MHRYIAPASTYCVDDRIDSDSTSAEDSGGLARIRDNTEEEMGVEETLWVQR
jgi:hypothetical protein